MGMNHTLEERAEKIGEYIAKSGATVRSAAGHFGLSKSTVHADVVKQNGLAGCYINEKTEIIRRGSRMVSVFRF